MLKRIKECTNNIPFDFLESCKIGNLEKVKKYINEGINHTSLLNKAVNKASQYGHDNIVHFLFEYGVDCKSRNNKAIRLASKNGHLKVVKLLLEHGSNCTAWDNEAIITASENGYLKIVRLLLVNGADCTVFNNRAIMSAIINGHLEIVKLLLEYGANYIDDYRDHDFVINLAKEKGHTKVVELLEVNKRVSNI